MNKFAKYFLIPIIILLIAATFGITPIQDFDIWWHIRLGGFTLHAASGLWRDAFSYTAYGQMYQNHSWLASVILYLLYTYGGTPGVSILALSITLGITFFLYKTLSAHYPNRWGINLLITFLTIWAISDRIDTRPYFWSTLLTIVYFYIISHPKRDSRNAIWFIIPLQMLWANFHGSAISGIVIVWLVLIGELFQSFIKHEKLFAAKNKRPLILAIGVILATLATPYTYNTLLYPVLHSNFYFVTHYTGEWLSPFSPLLKDALSIKFFYVVLILLPISFMVSWKSSKPAYILLASFTTYMAFTAHRFLPDFMLLSVPIIVLNLGGFRLDKFSAHERHIQLGAVLIVVAVCTNFLSHGVIKVTRFKDRIYVGFGTIPYYAPKDVVEFLDKNGITGRVFNDMAMGGYLLFSRPDEKVFIDGRTPLYGDNFYGRFLAAVLYPPDEFERLEKEYNLDYVVLLNVNAWVQADFHAYLWNRPDWALVHYSPYGSVYLKDVPKFKGVISKHRLAKNPTIETMRASGRQPRLFPNKLPLDFSVRLGYGK